MRGQIYSQNSVCSTPGRLGGTAACPVTARAERPDGWPPPEEHRKRFSPAWASPARRPWRRPAMWVPGSAAWGRWPQRERRAQAGVRRLEPTESDRPHVFVQGARM